MEDGKGDAINREPRESFTRGERWSRHLNLLPDAFAGGAPTSALGPGRVTVAHLHPVNRALGGQGSRFLVRVDKAVEPVRQSQFWTS